MRLLQNSIVIEIYIKIRIKLLLKKERQSANKFSCHTHVTHMIYPLTPEKRYYITSKFFNVIAKSFTENNTLVIVNNIPPQVCLPDIVKNLHLRLEIKTTISPATETLRKFV